MLFCAKYKIQFLVSGGTRRTWLKTWDECAPRSQQQLNDKDPIQTSIRERCITVNQQKKDYFLRKQLFHINIRFAMLKHTTNPEELPHKQPYIYTTNSTKKLKHDLTSKQIILFSKQILNLHMEKQFWIVTREHNAQPCMENK